MLLCPLQSAHATQEQHTPAMASLGLSRAISGSSVQHLYKSDGEITLQNNYNLIIQFTTKSFNMGQLMMEVSTYVPPFFFCLVCTVALKKKTKKTEGSHSYLHVLGRSNRSGQSGHGLTNIFVRSGCVQEVSGSV